MKVGKCWKLSRKLKGNRVIMMMMTYYARGTNPIGVLY